MFGSAPSGPELTGFANPLNSTKEVKKKLPPRGATRLIKKIIWSQKSTSNRVGTLKWACATPHKVDL